MQELIFKLHSPIQFGDKTIEELNIRKATAKDLIKANFKIQTNKDGGADIDLAQTIRLTAQLANVPPSVLEQISSQDAFALMAELTSFLLGGTD